MKNTDKMPSESGVTMQKNVVLSKEAYLENPCRASSVPYHKAKNITVPNTMAIVHRAAFDAEKYENYSDEVYFRLLNDMKNIIEPVIPKGFSVFNADISQFAEHINECYEDIKVTAEQVEGFTKNAVYDKELWVALIDHNGKTAATGIAEIDREIGEGAVEWVQVSHEHRRKGLGEYVVKYLLCKMKDKADFVTVSGKIRSSSQPEKLYRKCGFTGNDVWHILRKNRS